MSFWKLVADSLRHHWRASAAVALGVMVATAVLTGALLVGDSVRGSLRHLVVDRLGRIDDVLVANHFFRTELVAKLAAKTEFQRHFKTALPAVLLEATLETPGDVRRATGVNVVGANAGFWKLGDEPAIEWPSGDAIVLNAPLAAALSAKVEDEVLLRLPLAANIPADSPLGRKSETIRTRRLRVAAIIPARGLGRFGLRVSQSTPLTAFIPLATIQRALEQPNRVNAILVAGDSINDAPPAEADALLDRLIAPRLADYGLRLEKTTRGYFNLTSEQMLLDRAAVAAARRAYPAAQPALTYLANTIALAERAIPYSTVTALDPSTTPPLGPLVTTGGEALQQIGTGEIVLNTWAAEELKAKPGDMIRLDYFRPESTHGRTEETSESLRLAAVVKLVGAADDPDFTPTVKGITDEASIADWDPPFPFEASRVRKQDEDYWDQHRGAPKAFVALATGQRLWGSRFGEVTSVRIPPPSAAATVEDVAGLIAIDPAAMGFAFRPVKRLGIEAATGTTSFQYLFLGFSFFLILAALALVVLLFRLTIESRLSEMGLLAAVGLTAAQVRRLWSAEGLLIAAVGAVAGLALGVAYAALMLWGLNTWWVTAVSTPFVRLYITPTSLAIGLASSVIACGLAILWSLRQFLRLPPRQLLAGDAQAPVTRRAASPVAMICAAAALAGAIALSIFSTRLTAEAQAGGFVGAGALVMAALLIIASQRLRAPRAHGVLSAGMTGVAQLAARNSARFPSRSLLTMGLVAAASFLIVAISAFRLAAPADPTQRDSGTGGYVLAAQSDRPIFENLNDDERFSGLKPLDIVALRVQDGDDASCLNLYQAEQPRVLGLPARFIERGGFDWAASAATSEAERANPWLLLQKDYGQSGDGGEAILPVVIDAATAQYSLHLSGIGARFALPQTGGLPIECKVVGLLKNSMLQGDLLTSERHFLRAFPETSGYRFFLIDITQVNAVRAMAALERVLGDFGMDVERSQDRLANFIAVQNTYLSTFQSLGGLGLLLGTLGLAVVELRSVIERRRELALLRAIGLRRRRIGWLVVLELMALLCAGLGIGLIAASVAVGPHVAADRAALPWRWLAVMLALILLSALASSVLAIRAALAVPLAPALRGE
ncbi:MAG: FtsX-like permease family protein [Pirellulales bacterium]|nr:FtsX-like permease family protein [Pirellulales bacterium]